MQKARESHADYTAQNWQVIRCIYSGWAEFYGGTLRNIQLADKHFKALVLAARTKRFGRRSRADDSMRNAIGNWLYSSEYGAWRNPNRDRPYQAGNKELWESFIAATRDCSLNRALG